MELGKAPSPGGGGGRPGKEETRAGLPGAKGGMCMFQLKWVWKQMTGFQTTGDCSVDLGKTSQRIKMTRKGYQVQVERRKKADQLAKEKISAQIKSIRREIRDTEEQKNQLGEQEDVLRMNEESNGYHLLDERIGALETRNQAQIAGMCMTAFLALAGALLLALEAGSTIPAVLVGVAGVLAFIAELNFEMRTVRELEKRKRMKSRWIARQNKLEGGRSSLEEELREKNMELSNLTEELREMEEYAYLPLMEEVEIWQWIRLINCRNRCIVRQETDW